MFYQAKAIYPKGKSNEMNSFAAFRAVTKDLKGATLLITASSFYQLWVNEKFVSFGPARTAKGCARVDESPLEGYAKDGGKEILILVAGYNCEAHSTVRQPSFLQAELRKGDEVLLCTGRDFAAFLPPHRVKKVRRYALQRHFSEVWDFTGEKGYCDPAFRTETEEHPNPPSLLPRRAPYAHYEDAQAAEIAVQGTLRYDEALPFRSFPYSGEIEVRKGRFEEEEILYHPYEWIQRHHQEKRREHVPFPAVLSENEYAFLDFKRVEAGFLQLTAEAQVETELVIGFSEDSEEDAFRFTNMNAYNAMVVCIGRNQKIDFMSFEPYVGRFFFLGIKKGRALISRFSVKSFERTHEKVQLELPEDPVLRAICRGAIRAFHHNAVDIYMDCPSRERAGWLCDSYFTGKTEYALYGNTRVEDAYLENYRLYAYTGNLPKGAIPMCYPADDDHGRFIPQWTMWYILEAEDYIFHRGHLADREKFGNSVRGLLGFYKEHENGDGLLEKLPSWNFVEWSKANQWTQDVNYPTNFLYAQTLEAAAHILGETEWADRAREVRRQTILQSFDGNRFYDHAVRNEKGELELQKDCSEIAQYYAILFGDFDVDTKEYAPLKNLVLNRCIPDGPDYPKDMEPINAFIGVYLRMEALLKMKAYGHVLSEARAFFGEMEAVTGTLWEFRQRKGSRDHGFASYAYVAILQALKGKEN